MINFKNGWKSNAKQSDKCIIEIRFGRFTILELYCNPGVEHRCIILNFGFEL